MTGKGTYKLIKIKNRSQDPHERNTNQNNKNEENEDKKSDGYQIKSGINMNQTANNAKKNFIDQNTDKLI